MPKLKKHKVILKRNYWNRKTEKTYTITSLSPFQKASKKTNTIKAQKGKNRKKNKTIYEKKSRI